MDGMLLETNPWNGASGYRIHISMVKVILFLLIFVSGCTSIKDCKVAPTVEIEKTEKTENTDKKQQDGAMDAIRESIDNAKPGGRVKCEF
jgi:PBP1b-binding outer membrane lipoprotein LpoB